MTAKQRYLRGLGLTTLGMLVLSVDSLMVKLIAAPTLDQVAWRGIPMAFVVLLLFMPVFRTVGGMAPAFRQLGWLGLVAALLYSSGSIGFVGGIELTNVSTLLVIVATTPMFTAIAGWLLYGATVPMHTKLAMVATFVGIALAVNGWLAGGSWFGLAVCFIVPIGLGTFLTILEHNPHIDNLACLVVASFVTGAIGLGFGSPFDIDGVERGLALLHGSVILPIAFALYTIGPKYLTGPETGLLLLLETVLGTFWVWLILGEEPALLTLVGGAIVILAVSAHALYSLRLLDAAERAAARPA
ncbi:MAG: DMT family transporter [Pseudomonadota bacterium]